MTRIITATVLMLFLALLLAGCSGPQEADGSVSDSEPLEDPREDPQGEPGSSGAVATRSEEFSAQEFLVVSRSDGDTSNTHTTRIGDNRVLVRSGALRLTVEAVFTASVAVESWRVCAFADGQAPDRERLCATGTDQVTLVIESTEDNRLRPGDYFVLTWVNKPDDLPTGVAFAATIDWHATVEYPTE